MALKTVSLVLPLVCAAAWGQQTATAKAQSAADRCHGPHASIDTCDDAIRWNPRDPSLLVAMGDAEMRAKRLADAARAYRRAAAIAPGTPGLQQKIAGAETQLAKSKAAAAHPAVAASAAKHYSNADPDSQSH